MLIFVTFSLLMFLGFWVSYVNQRRLQFCVMTGLGLRLGLGGIEYLVADLPFSGGDSVAFLDTAAEWARNGFFSALEAYPGPSSYFISWPIALVFSILGENEFIAIGFSILFGTLAIGVTYHLSMEIYSDTKIAVRAAWIIALFPMLAMLAATVLREAYILYFFGLGMLFLLRWYKGQKLIHLVSSLTSLIIATFYHGGMVVAIILVTIVAIFVSFKRLLSGTSGNSKGSVQAALLAIAGPIIMLYLFQAGVEVPKIGNLSSSVTEASFAEKLLRDAANARGGAVYPSWILPNNSFELILKAPVLLFYFQFGPFIWDARSLSQLIAVFDAFCQIAVFWLLWKGWKLSKATSGARAVFWVSLITAWVFAMSTSNFGTSIRHRAKFSVVFVALAPVAPKRQRSPSPASPPYKVERQSMGQRRPRSRPSAEFS